MSNDSVVYKFNSLVSSDGKEENNTHELREKRKREEEKKKSSSEVKIEESTLANPWIFRKMRKELNSCE